MIVEAIVGTIFSKVLDRITKSDVPVDNKDANEVATKVTAEIAPVIVNAVNAEPWYKSRIYLGLLVGGIGIVAGQFGYTLPGEEIDNIVTLVGEAAQVLGLLFALYGRLVGAKKPPLFE